MASRCASSRAEARRIVRLTHILIALLAALLLGSCTAEPKPDELKTRVVLIGTIHQGHVSSTRFSLARLESAIREIDPDQIFTEIPPDRLDAAIDGFQQTGKVSEPRVVIFPEYRDMLFPLSKAMDFEIIPVAAWTQKIADDRRAALARIRSDPSRAKQWSEYQAAQQEFVRAVRGRRDDPRFIHSDRYDALVEAQQTPYQKYFDDDLGAGGWARINAAHYALIDDALDRISGEGKSVVILFGAWHKYMLLRELEKRSDIELADPASYFPKD